ncbi:MAG: hypothetical protein AAF266_01000 [Planctomycetota bacterium]
MTLTKTELRVLETFREYLMTPNQMLCFSGPDLESKKSALESLADKEVLTRELRDGAYSLTAEGYAQMNEVTTSA